MWNHPVDMERVSYVMSNLQREPIGTAEDATTATRRRSMTASDAKVANVLDVEGAEPDADVNDGHYPPSHQFVDAATLSNPPILKPRRSCCCTLIGVWVLFVMCTAAIIGVQIYHTHLREVDERRAFERRVARDDSILDRLEFGIWDSMGMLTKLQLQVAVSLALGARADDGDVHVMEQENAFYSILIDHATIEECDFVNSDAFATELNVHTRHYDGKCVLSKRARLLKHTSHREGVSERHD